MKDKDGRPRPALVVAGSDGDRERNLDALVEKLNAAQAAGESASFRFGDVLVEAFPRGMRGVASGWSEWRSRLAREVGVSEATLDERRTTAVAFPPAERAAIADTLPGVTIRWGVWARWARQSDRGLAEREALRIGVLRTGRPGILTWADVLDHRARALAADSIDALSGAEVLPPESESEVVPGSLVEAVTGEIREDRVRDARRALRAAHEALTKAEEAADGALVTGAVWTPEDALSTALDAERLAVAARRVADVFDKTVRSIRDSATRREAHKADAPVTVMPAEGAPTPQDGGEESEGGNAFSELRDALEVAERVRALDDPAGYPRVSKAEREDAAMPRPVLGVVERDGLVVRPDGDAVQVKDEGRFLVAYRVAEDGTLGAPVWRVGKDGVREYANGGSFTEPLPF